MKRTIGSLFSGIGGLELGLERAGLGTVVWQCEIDPFCRKVLAKHWPIVAQYEDVKEVTNATAMSVDVLCGGFPCTDLSHAARGRARSGLAGSASGLWYEMLRVISELSPQVVVIENVASAWRDWLPIVRRDLWARGYSSLPIRVRAADVGSPQGRPRVFVVAYPHGDGERFVSLDAKVARIAEALCVESPWTPYTPPPVGVAPRVPVRMDTHRLRALGNAVAPLCAEVVGRAIAEALS